jgi:excisionase family DNA binding protein
MNESADRFLTPPQIAKLLRVSRTKILAWIRRGELKAVNLGDGTRSRFRISSSDLRTFLAAREVQPPTRRYNRKREPPEGGPIDPVLGEALIKKGQATKFCGKYYRIWNGVILFY